MALSVAALIVAAGRGIRSGGGIPKQYRQVAGDPVLRLSAGHFLRHPQIGQVQAVIHPDDRELYDRATAGLGLLPPVAGGATRQLSVKAGLEALAQSRPDLVLVHDAARPFLTAALVSRAIDAAQASGAAIPALPVTDTMKRVDAGGRILETLDRATLRSVQTPQAFSFEALLSAHRRAAAAGRDDFTDDASLAEWAGLAVTTFEGEADNVKLTTSDDFLRAEALRGGTMLESRTGFGFDVHAFADGDHVTLGGVRIPHSQALAGHSDADVGLHALVDAILGALAEGDIGDHFPPSDPQWRGATSDRFLRFAVDRVRARNGRIVHLDLTFVAEAPKIGPHRDAIRARIAEIAGIAAGRVGVKATTNEKMGFIGRREGMAAYATATIALPRTDNDAG
ncbi:MAG TPA: bifunctional 2-C-methyl-D-erythritol 4-phosphate cytidylyltransferase/2-C-methyl-D-erythritol 2,4-cyclodiphosphate synthase [Pseudorhodoplanes sp.]|jgi:2-C-methyl-D-erythritol 4-phosphate cytidylyltransferase/2-C-methyl-D-erythritol 2,4-cyclodiphosphate synthase|nr:bifunctional 2-C-methyl-D-erythritol 4-phosphate cytidylyltransferase/2-C-methyl-D-erythritol 2,4-cyclodiphosphate synthase [Pseudorhodoplanes sp.]